MSDWLKKFFLSPIHAWDAFWFEPNDEKLRSVAIFRILFCATMLFFYISRVPDISFFYSEQGLLPSSYAQTVDYFRYHPSIFFGMKSLTSLYIFHGIFLSLLLMLSVGLLTRFVAPLTFFFHLMFLNRNMTVMFGVDMISTFFFLYLIFSNSGAYYSLDKKLFCKNSWLYRSSASTINHIALRLMQIQLCVIYAFSGLEKLKGTRWWDGSAIWDVLTMGDMQRWDMSFVAHVPVLLAMNAYAVLFWEIYFPFLVWKKELRNYILLIGVFLHLGIGIFMNLPSFAALMISIYALFLSGEEIKRSIRW